MSTDNHNVNQSTTSTQRHPKAESFWLPGGRTGVLIVHGYGGSIGDYRDLADDLVKAGYSVKGLRLAGHGGTPADLAASHIDDWRQSVFSAARQLKQDCDEILIIGVSFGGSLALDYVIHAPEKILAVITVNTPLSYKSFGPLTRLGLRLLRLVTPYFRKPGLSSADRERMHQIGSLDRWPIDGIFETTTFLKTFVVPALSRLRVPVLLIQSSDDPYVDPASAESLLTRIPTEPKALFQLESRSHRPLRDPELRRVVVRRIQDFLGQLAKRN